MAELHGMSDQDLVHRLLQLERDLVGARFKHSRGQLENTAALRVMRRDIARLRTEARRREGDAGLAKDVLLHTHRSTFAVVDSVSGGDESAEKGGFLSGIVDRLTGNE